MTAQAYSAGDRLLHRLAFSGIGLQRNLSELEDDLFRARIVPVETKPPVFITSLPRAGTTILLQTLAGAGGFASHTYRDMPFLLCPMLWDRVSQGFRRRAAQRPRGHGDGLTIGYDSAEAFEEVLWRAFWPGHYLPDRISLWRANEEATGFGPFLKRHMRKIVALRMPHSAAGRRYISKNNANIARVGLLRRLFPGSTVLVPFRRPLDQAMSLRRQHLEAQRVYAGASFAREYVESLGHFEFGPLLRPFAFEGFAEYAAMDRQSPAFWLRYWIAAFEHLLQQEAVFVSYENFCLRPRRALGALNELWDTAISSDAARDVREAVAYDAMKLELDRGLMERAEALHAALIAKCINP